MPTGTDAGLLDSPKPQSVYKHGILEQYVIRFAAMTASSLNPKRSVLFDGFAGRGRFDTGEAASAEHMMLAAQKAKPTTRIDLLLIEKAARDFDTLDKVADEYRAHGISIDARQGDCADHLDDALKLAAGASMFVFLDPCGAVLPMDSIKEILRRRGSRPRTRDRGRGSAGMTDQAAPPVLKSLPMWDSCAVDAGSPRRAAPPPGPLAPAGSDQPAGPVPTGRSVEWGSDIDWTCTSLRPAAPG